MNRRTLRDLFSTLPNEMGQEPSFPRVGDSIQVIGAGLPRTGTTSLALALHVLLDGPVYDGGTQLCKLSSVYEVYLRHTLTSYTNLKGTASPQTAPT